MLLWRELNWCIAVNVSRTGFQYHNIPLQAGIRSQITSGCSFSVNYSIFLASYNVTFIKLFIHAVDTITSNPCRIDFPTQNDSIFNWR